MNDFIVSGRLWFDGVQDPVLWAEEGKIVYCNPAAKQLNLWENELLPEAFQVKGAAQYFSVEWADADWSCHKVEMEQGELLQLTRIQCAEISLTRVNQMAEKMRTPLSNLYSSLQMLSMPEVEENVEKFHMYHGIQRKNYYMIHRMLDNVEILCYFSDAHTHLEMHQINLSDMCADVVAELKHLFQQAGRSITIENKEPILLVNANGWAVRHMLYELLSNALRHAPKGGSVWMKVARNGKRVRITVGNSGDGFAPDKMARAFDPTAVTEELIPGSGLGVGISICRLIVERHGGRIALLSGKGGTVMVELPLREYIDAGPLHSPRVDCNGGLNSALIQLSDALPWQCFVDDED